jgi:hypothetical protein
MRRGPKALIPIVALLAAAALVPSGSASGRGATLHSELIKSFNGFVVCGVNVKQLGGVTCVSPALPATELDGYALLHKHGRVSLGERGDSPFEAGTTKSLKKGRRWSRVGIVCARKPNAVRCHNQDGHGIRLSPKSYKVF